MTSAPIRILQIVPNLSPHSGIVRVVLHWHRHLDTTRVQFDYLYFKPFEPNCLEEITRLGGKCTFLPYKQPLKLLAGLFRFFKQNRYAIIHSHVLQLPLFIFPLAKFYGTKYIIEHAHATRWSNKKLSAVRNYLMLHAVWPLITHRLACSEKAGRFFFKRNFSVLNNSIEAEQFAYNPQVRAQKRKELDLENNFVIGHVGRLSSEKNHLFLIAVLEKLVCRYPNAKLILVGEGPLEQPLKNKTREKLLDKHVLFLGPRDDVPGLLQAFDVFVFPSLFEGLGLGAIEAQAAGLPCVLANTLPKEAFICNYKKMPLGSAEDWAQALLKLTADFQRKDTSELIKKADFDATQVALKMQHFYTGLEQ